jgi:tetratricopeptide (TPR) repeat protein
MILLFVVGIFSTKDSDNTAVPEEVEKDEASEAAQKDDETIFIDKGNGFFSDAQYDSALKYYEKTLYVNPLNQYALYNKALVFSMKKDFWGSISIVKKCLRLDPDYNEGLWLLGDDFASVNYYDSAIFTLERAYRNGYADPGFLQLMGEVYLKKDNRAKATELYKKVLEQDSSKVDVYRQLAELDPANAVWYRKKAEALELFVK